MAFKTKGLRKDRAKRKVIVGSTPTSGYTAGTKGGRKRAIAKKRKMV